MNTNDNLMPTNVTNLITNFSNLVRTFTIKETEWQIQKEDYEKKISELEGEVKAHENINVDLLKRIRMLEYALNQERQKNNTKTDNLSPNIVPPDNSLFNDLAPQNLIKEEDLKFLKESTNRPSLISILQTIGIDENLANNLFVDFELNRTELEAMIKKNLDEKLAHTGQDNITEIVNQKSQSNTANNTNSNDIPINNQNQINRISANNSAENNNTDSRMREELNSVSFSFNNCIELRSHFDEVRKLSYFPEMNSLVSVSEDCLIKIWSLNYLFSNSQYKVLDPYLTLRGHTGPLYCTERGIDGSNLLYTGGNEGLIQIWNVPGPDEVPQYGQSETLFNMNVGFFQKTEEGEIIWDLKHHPTSNLLISLSSDATINFWKTTTAEEYVKAFTTENFNEKWLISSKTKKANYLVNGDFAIPTTCSFLKTESNKLVVGFNDATISIMDVEKGYFNQHYNTFNEQISHLKNVNRVLYQPNCFALSNSLPLIYSGFEDNSIKILDLRDKDGITTNNQNAHSDSVTSLNLLNDIYLFSVSHDTTIKIWDIRKFNDPIVSTVCSQKKWDEAMWDSLLIENSMLFCVACADCTVKLYKL